MRGFPVDGGGEAAVGFPVHQGVKESQRQPIRALYSILIDTQPEVFLSMLPLPKTWSDYQKDRTAPFGNQ